MRHRRYLLSLLHSLTVKAGFEFHVYVQTALVILYAVCGYFGEAHQVFDEMPDRNLVTWNALITGLMKWGRLAWTGLSLTGCHRKMLFHAPVVRRGIWCVLDIHNLQVCNARNGKQAANSFKRMEDECLKPNRVTFLSILNACSHGGLVEEGLGFFRKMVNECQVEPDIRHYGCLVDMLGRAGTLEEAEKIALQIPNEIENVVIWRTLLGACSFHGNIQMGERVMRKILDMEKRYGRDYVLLSNIFAGFGRFEDAVRVRRLMDESNAPKVPGLSSS
ncbi:pentatricopeptide repeat (PPR) superfamily protein [Actinidia rufa]|uniref:Pentatricopeptide repeat (PPR) superfamily protein n=1 Tax=Actinidia rufa TaxID=165716 RepID=A0A7J0HED2_9ERIC|nr:pentatricopeptide repeat (PPR) superfamily protein [Actinidia rufa]